MRASILPEKVRIIQEIDDPEWRHTLVLEDRDGGEVRAYLNQETYTALWKAVESPEIPDADIEPTPLYDEAVS